MATRFREDFRSLSGTEKASLLLMSLGEESASQLISYMDEDEIR